MQFSKQLKHAKVDELTSKLYNAINETEITKESCDVDPSNALSISTLLRCQQDGLFCPLMQLPSDFRGYPKNTLVMVRSGCATCWPKIHLCILKM